jgi:predicted  nucleic acid-binding Zn-ribbon protein
MPQTLGKKKKRYILSTLKIELEDADKVLNNVRIELEHLNNVKSSNKAIKMLEDMKKDYNVMENLMKSYKSEIESIEVLIEKHQEDI